MVGESNASRIFPSPDLRKYSESNHAKNVIENDHFLVPETVSM